MPMRTVFINISEATRPVVTIDFVGSIYSLDEALADNHVYGVMAPDILSKKGSCRWHRIERNCGSRQWNTRGWSVRAVHPQGPEFYRE